MCRQSGRSLDYLEKLEKVKEEKEELTGKERYYIIKYYDKQASTTLLYSSSPEFGSYRFTNYKAAKCAAEKLKTFPYADADSVHIYKVSNISKEMFVE